LLKPKKAASIYLFDGAPGKCSGGGDGA